MSHRVATERESDRRRRRVGNVAAQTREIGVKIPDDRGRSVGWRCQHHRARDERIARAGVDPEAVRIFLNTTDGGPHPNRLRGQGRFNRADHVAQTAWQRFECAIRGRRSFPLSPERAKEAAVFGFFFGKTREQCTN